MLCLTCEKAVGIQFIDHLFGMLKFLRRQSKIDIQGEGKVAAAAGDTTTFEVFSHDWTYVQGALQMLQLVNEFSAKLNTFDRTVRNRLLNEKEKIFGEDASLTSGMASYVHAPAPRNGGRSLTPTVMSWEP